MTPGWRHYPLSQGTPCEICGDPAAFVYFQKYNGTIPNEFAWTFRVSIVSKILETFRCPNHAPAAVALDKGTR